MTKATLSAVTLCAALTFAAGAAPARPLGQAAHGAQPAQTKTAQKPAAQPQAGSAKTKGDGAKSSHVAAAPPKVTQIGHEELKSLLGAGAGRPRPLLVNFWATWCAPCREEFPDLVKIRQQYAADKLDFILVSLDDPVDIGKAVPEFLTEAGATAFPVYLLYTDDDNAAINLVDPTWNGELPATFLYDRSGALAFKHRGRVKPDELRAALDEALKEKPQEAGAPK